MEQKRWKGKWSYKPGRTPEELEDERRRESLRLSYTERFLIMRHLMKRQQLLSTGKITTVKSD